MSVIYSKRKLIKTTIKCHHIHIGTKILKNSDNVIEAAEKLNVSNVTDENLWKIAYQSPAKLNMC